jgi:hypothetical protein
MLIVLALRLPLATLEQEEKYLTPRQESTAKLH